MLLRSAIVEPALPGFRTGAFISTSPGKANIPAIVVPQWMRSWDEIHFDAASGQSQPAPHFLMFSMPAATLRALSGINRRSAATGRPRAEDAGIQRQHDPDRSDEIREFVQYGYPLSSLGNNTQERLGENLRKPGWLPTAIVVNILMPGEIRNGRTLAVEDSIKVPHITGDDAVVNIGMPSSWNGHQWQPTDVQPIEVIDGQHRLWAFDAIEDADEMYSLPVVAFLNLDVSWQAYLFWTINIKPKRINASLAFDLYPLLRQQDWLEAGEGLHVYRETRAQELTEALWSTPSSPWYQRINMLGESGVANSQPVRQASFIRSLVTAFVKPWTSTRNPIGGLFGTDQRGGGLEWSRAQQAAFLIEAWASLVHSIRASDFQWAVALRGRSRQINEFDDLSVPDPAFISSGSLLASDQGVRPFMQVVNDLCFVRRRDLRLQDWRAQSLASDVTPELVEQEAAELRRLPTKVYLNELGSALATYDWRSSKAPGLTDEQRRQKLAYRGSSGYKELRIQLIKHLAAGDFARVSEDANAVLDLRDGT